ncbi:MAG TPA: prepilin-type N-terminal cleavage/methylation domain-containing protein [Gemmatimonadales bacterium]|nr:prepilin-type N-terminal cleavage/methylation domain-containing protein [Gemmatimonadales bacterium]
MTIRRFLVRARRALRRKGASRRGYTIVELLVAVMVFSIGLLAMAGTASLIMMTIAGSQTRNVAAAVAESRFESLRAQTCTAHASGTAVTRGLREDWSVKPLARADDVTVVVTMLSNHRVRTQAFRSYLPCS